MSGYEIGVQMGLKNMGNFHSHLVGCFKIHLNITAGINDRAEVIAGIAALLARVRPTTAYLSIPIRPPAEKGIAPPDAQALNRAYQILCNQIPNAEYLVGYEGDAFAASGNVAADLLSITAVHPLREDAVQKILTRADAGWEAVRELIARGQLEEVEYEGQRFYLRRLRPKN